MITITKLENLENEYRKRIGEKPILSADAFIGRALTLFAEIKVAGTDEADDVLLFQYGVCDWGDDNGEHFAFDITRQIINPAEDEPYQLNFTLIFEVSADFAEIDRHTVWSDDYDTLDDFAAHIKSTSGYVSASKANPQKYQLIFGQC
jgi:hypothetical protein